MNTYHVIFRTCDVVHSLHNAPRPFDLSKRELIKVCFISLVESLKGYSHTIHVVGDRLSDELITFFEQYQCTLTIGEYGNDESIRQCLRLAYARPDDEWVYLCEDDYLHAPEAFLWIDDLVSNRKEYMPGKVFAQSLRFIKLKLGSFPLIIHPPDYPDRYKRRYTRFSLIFLSRFCHWRQITNTTFTFMAEARTLKKFRRILDRSCKGADDGYLSRTLFAGLTFRGKALCISPIPGVATHMHEEVMTPLVDWKSIYESNKQKLEKFEGH